MPGLVRFEDQGEHARALIEAALVAADPAAALARHWDSGLDDVPCVLLAVGKASVPMAREALGRLKRVRRGLVTGPPDQVEGEGLSVPVLACDHPFPTARNVEAARAVEELVKGAGEDETLVVLMSGGGSAHLALPREGLTVDDIAAITRLLQRAGATIGELNCVRKHCEQLKGGRLAAMSGAGRMVVYILSDVIGDRLDVISSGPTVADPTTYGEAIEVLGRFGLMDAVPPVTGHLRRGVVGEIEETPKPGDAALARVTNRIIASNRLVVEAVAEEARGMGFALAGVEQGVEGEAAEVGRRLGVRARELKAGTCWVIGGETTVAVGSGSGVGGPSQELALGAAVTMEGSRAVVLTFSTDGRDGPTDAAGAVVTGETCGRLRAAGVDVARALAEHDSYNALDRVGALVKVAPTGTNLNHVAVLMVYG